jgi:hypothetical protein
MKVKMSKNILILKKDEMDICVSCGAETLYKKTDNIDFRCDYIEGAGQICHTCYQSQNLKNLERLGYGQE